MQEYKHESIEVGKTSIQALGLKNNFEVDTTVDATVFTEDKLKKYHAVVFLNTTGDVLNLQQQNAFKRFIQAGGGYVGVHAAADTEYDWWWYGKLVGAYFESHTEQQEATVVKQESNEFAFDFPTQVEHFDEWYNFKNISPTITPLFTLDESSYEGGLNGDDHPIVWYQEFDGGRSFYTGLGHTTESYSEPFFLEVLEKGIEYAIGDASLDYDKVKDKILPEETRFTKNVLGYYFFEPTEMTILPDGKIIFLERRGLVKLFDPKADTIKVINSFKVNTTFEDGLIGLTKDPAFEKNHWIYILYSHPERSANVLSRFSFENDSIDTSSEVELLAVAVQRESCCHTGGSLAFDAHGNLFISTGDNSSPFQSNGFAPADERPDRSPYDAQKSSSNANDLRGKILRIHPQDDGTYTIPDGNLFPVGTKDTRPEIYVMGNRNPYRISVDSKTSYLYWGEVGPDAGNDSETRGPRGYDEVNRAKQAGNFGWPMFVGNNYAYARYDFATEEAREFHDPLKPLNSSPNNTGIQQLPPAQPALIWYPYDDSPDFPLVGTGGRNAMAGPIYYPDQYKNKSSVALPEYIEGKLIIYDWMRNWVQLVSFDDQENIIDIEPFLENLSFHNIMDMEISSDGVLYTLEYGTKWYGKNVDARLSRIEFNRGNQSPTAMLSTEKTNGVAPFSVKFNTAGSIDPDGDEITYELVIGKEKLTSPSGDFEYVFQKNGIYHATLFVRDASGATASAEQTIVVGNTPPSVTIEWTGNSEFYLDKSNGKFQVHVQDEQDGSLENGGVDPSKVFVTLNYSRRPPPTSEPREGHQTAELSGSVLIADSDCKACHTLNEKSAGPSYLEIANRYGNSKDQAINQVLAEKIINGGSGEWGETAMAAHPQITIEEAQAMVAYILSIGKESRETSIGTKGTLKFQQHTAMENFPPFGAYQLTASYEDKGNGTIPSFSSTHSLVFKAPFLSVADIESQTGAFIVQMNGRPVIGSIMHEGSIKFRPVDLTNVKALDTWILSDTISQGGKMEVYIDENKIGVVDLLSGKKMTKDSKLTIPLGNLKGKHQITLRFYNEQAEGKKITSLRGIELN